MADYRYPPLRRCIYCGATTPTEGAKRFGDEHIVPLALGGNLVLPEGSCRKCEKTINEQIETPVLLKEWVYLRIKRNFPSRGKSRRRPTHVTLQNKDGTPLRVAISDYSTPVPLYKFKEARILSAEPRADNNTHWTLDVLTDTPAEQEMRRKYPSWNGVHSLMPQPFTFARLLAKIAHSRAVAEYGLEGFTPLGLDIILGRSDDFFHTVGGLLEVSPAVPGGDHVLDFELLFRSATKAHLIIEIRLFSQITTPTYRVVAGEIDLENKQHSALLAKHRADGKLSLKEGPSQ